MNEQSICITLAEGHPLIRIDEHEQRIARKGIRCTEKLDFDDYKDGITSCLNNLSNTQLQHVYGLIAETFWPSPTRPESASQKPEERYSYTLRINKRTGGVVTPLTKEELFKSLAASIYSFIGVDVVIKEKETV